MSKSFKLKVKAPESVRESKLIQDLRKQVIKLRREVAQLKKKNSRIENDYADYLAEVESDEAESVTDFQALVNTKKADKEECPKCGAYEIINFIAGPHKFYKCSSCGTKGRIE